MRTTYFLALTVLLFSSGAVLTGCSDATSQNDDKAKAAGHDHAKPAALVMPPPGETPRPADAKLYIISPVDGATVEKTFTIQFGLKGMGVAPAGIYMGDEMPTGHHHLLIDVDKIDLSVPVMKDETHVHFGGGQTEGSITLKPGEHTLQLLLADHSHMPHKEPLLSKKITVTVK